MKTHSGIIVPMVTPFTANRQLDETAVCRLVEHILNGGAHGIFILGTTGEALSIPFSMRKQLIRLVTKEVGEKGLVYTGIADNCLEHSLELAAHSFGCGVDAVVAHPPFYYAIGNNELIDFFSELADKTGGPLLIYNIPQTTGISVPLEVIERLRQHKNIIGVKDSENDVARLSELTKRFGGRDDFSVLVGCNSLSKKVLYEGADGLVPSLGNIAPDACRQLFDNVKTGNEAGAQEAQNTMNQVVEVYQNDGTSTTTFAALKVALSIMGLCQETVLPPLRALTDAERQTVLENIQKLGSLKALS